MLQPILISPARETDGISIPLYKTTPRNAARLALAHIGLTFVGRASPFACDLAPFPSNHSSLATHCQQKSEQAEVEPSATLRG
jgi:hypothetical protein